MLASELRNTGVAEPTLVPAVKANKSIRRQQLERQDESRRPEGCSIGDQDRTRYKKYNSFELSRVHVMSNAKSMWMKVCQLTGRCKIWLTVIPPCQLKRYGWCKNHRR